MKNGRVVAATEILPNLLETHSGQIANQIDSDPAGSNQGMASRWTGQLGDRNLKIPGDRANNRFWRDYRDGFALFDKDLPNIRFTDFGYSTAAGGNQL